MRDLVLALLFLLAPGVAYAAITFDAQSEGTGTTTLSWSHTPAVATAEGVIVFCINNTSSTDVFSGATYDGEAMTQITSAADAVGEPGFTEAYFKGSSVNTTSPATVVCTVSSGSSAKHGVAFTVQAAGDVQLAGTGSCVVQGDVDDPNCAITGIAGASWAAGGIFSGKPTEGNITAGAGFTLGHSHDFTDQITSSEYATTQQASGNWTVAFTTSGAADDVAMTGIAIEQVTPDSTAKILTIGGE